MESLDSYANDAEQYIDSAVEMAIAYAPKLLLAIITLLVGLKVISMVTKMLRKTLDNRGFDASLTGFLMSLTGIFFKLLLGVTVIGMIGVQTTSLIAVIGAAGLAVGLALQGSLSNFAGSVLVLIFKPFKVGDVVTLDGELGTVKEIQVFNTILTTPDGKTVILPNGSVANGKIVNLSMLPTKRLQLVFGIGYSDDIGKAKEILAKIADEENRILKDPAPFIAVSELADSSVNIMCRFWTKSEDYWDVNFALFEKVKLAFDEAGVSIPFPQRDVHIFNEGLMAAASKGTAAEASTQLQ